jgi:NDP-sugar pyrophosphorylase family protein
LDGNLRAPGSGPFPSHCHPLSFQVLFNIPILKSLVGGYPMIFHHLKALSNLAEVKNVFLLGGSYDEKKFRPFMDQVRTQFNFKITFIEEEIIQNSAGALFYYKDLLL